jgi:hypothetical protein
VSATVIPVLFLAFALQTSFVEWLRKAAEAANEALDSPNPRRARGYGLGMLVIFLASIGRLTLFFGILGEVLALSALMDDWDYAYIRHVIFWVTIFLLAEVVAGLAFATFSPEIMLYRMMARTFFREQPTETAQDSRDLKAERKKKESQITDDQP